MKRRHKGKFPGEPGKGRYRGMEAPYEKKVLGITAMTKLLGKANFNRLLEKLLVKPVGKPTLVPKDDPRPEMRVSAEDDFKEEE